MNILFAQFKKILGDHLLQLNRPAPVITAQEADAEVERNYRWNFTFNLLDGVAYWIGQNFAAPATILPLFISKFTMNPLMIGLVAVIAQAGWNLPQLFFAGYIERIPRKKVVMINVGFFLQRLPLWVWPFAAILSIRFPLLAVGMVLGAYAWHTLGAGAIAPAWQDLIARCFPVTRRGRFFGLTTFIGTGVGVFSAMLSSWLLKTFTFPLNFFWVFCGSAAFITLSWGFLAFVREPVLPVEPQPHGRDLFWQKFRAILRQDHNFRRFLYARFLMNFGGMGVGFVAISAVRQWQTPDSTVGLFTVALLLGQAAGNLFAGFFADRFGHKRSLEISAASAVLAYLLAWFAPSPAWYYAVFVWLGVAIGGSIVSGVMIPMEFSSPAQRPTYVGIANTLTGVGGGLAPLIGGWIAQTSYDWLFALSAGVNLLSIILFAYYVKEPRHHRPASVY